LEDKFEGIHSNCYFQQFDAAIIPMKKWSEHEQELLEKQETMSMYSHSSSHYNDVASIRSGISSKSKRKSLAAGKAPSVYGGSQHGGSDTASFYGGATAAYPPAMPMAMPMPGATPPMQYLAPASNRNSMMATSSVVGNRMSWMSAAPSEMHGMMNFPTDAEIQHQVKVILSTADLMTVTKKKVREELARHFGGIDLSSKKDFIHQCIDAVLKGDL
jgi:chitin synthase